MLVVATIEFGIIHALVFYMTGLREVIAPFSSGLCTSPSQLLQPMSVPSHVRSILRVRLVDI